MKKPLLAILIALSINLSANPGDTTWIQANNVKLNYYNNFDTAVAFPNGSKTYRKILMVFTLGEYACPSGSQYCHQWDYTVTNYVMTKTDTVELSRFITPYANTGVPRFPASWKQPYIFNVTDFATLLKDSATIRILYSGYSGGFTANVKFAFIEGTPERNVFGVAPVWSGAYNFGNPADPIDNHVTPHTLAAPANTNAAELKFTVTGHGSDSLTGCCEFALNSYSVTLNNLVIDTMPIWRDDCGSNELYPQGGTWVFNRGNWCPGASVNVNTHPLTGVTASSTYSLDVDFSAYSNAPYQDYGDYDVEGHVFYYGNLNHTLDASIEDIIAPNSDVNHFRENPTGNKPVIRVHNAGSTPITSIVFSYNVKDSTAIQYTWTGTLASMHDTDITLAPLNTLTNMSLAGLSGTHYFTAKIISVNGSVDQDTTNNIFNSAFVVAPKWPTAIVVNFSTNSEGVNGVGVAGPSETTWQIEDMNGNILFSRLNANISTTYKDTINLPANGFYKLTLEDAGCDGLQWWVWAQNPSYGITAGAFFLKKVGGPLINMNGYTTSGTYGNDFGCGFTQYFTTASSVTGINTFAANTTISMKAFPNPTQNNVTILLNGVESANGQFEILDGLGRKVLEQKASGVDNVIDLSSLSNGIYTIAYRDAQVSQITTRLIVIK